MLTRFELCFGLLATFDIGPKGQNDPCNRPTRSQYEIKTLRSCDNSLLVGLLEGQHFVEYRDMQAGSEDQNAFHPFQNQSCAIRNVVVLRDTREIEHPGIAARRWILFGTGYDRQSRTGRCQEGPIPIHLKPVTRGLYQQQFTKTFATAVSASESQRTTKRGQEKAATSKNGNKEKTMFDTLRQFAA